MEKNCRELKNALFTAAKGEYFTKLFGKLSMADTAILDYLYEDISSTGADISGKQLKDIAAEMNISRPALTQQINRLEARRIIRRVTAPNGKRAVYIRFTEYGLELYKKEKASLDESIMAIADAFGESDCERFIELIKKLESISQKQ